MVLWQDMLDSFTSTNCPRVPTAKTMIAFHANNTLYQVLHKSGTYRIFWKKELKSYKNCASISNCYHTEKMFPKTCYRTHYKRLSLGITMNLLWNCSGDDYTFMPLFWYLYLETIYFYVYVQPYLTISL